MVSVQGVMERERKVSWRRKRKVVMEKEGGCVMREKAEGVLKRGGGRCRGEGRRKAVMNFLLLFSNTGRKQDGRVFWLLLDTGQNLVLFVSFLTILCPLCIPLVTFYIPECQL